MGNTPRAGRLAAFALGSTVTVLALALCWAAIVMVAAGANWIARAAGLW